jgi:hypothetical protein
VYPSNRPKVEAHDLPMIRKNEFVRMMTISVKMKASFAANIAQNIIMAWFM